MEILDYLESKNIIVEDKNFHKSNYSITNYNISKQIELIIEVEKILMGKKDTILPRIDSSIGKEVESMKVQVRKSLKNMSLLEQKENKNSFDYYILEEGNKIINRAKKSIEALNKDEYLSLIMRSMNKYEICLGRVDEGNLKIENGVINIRTIKYLSYNMIEQDCYCYLKRLKKRGYQYSIESTINDFISKSDLGKASENYIKVLANYPLESMKLLMKLKYEKEKLTEEEWIKEINISRNIDGKELF